jgi:hypothetical protein
MLTGGTIASHIAVAAPITNTGGKIGLAIDSTVFAVTGGDLTLSVLTTKGDLLTRTATGYARLPVGSNGQVLEANSATTTGLQWVAGGGGGGVPVTGPFEYYNGNPLTDTNNDLYYSTGALLADNNGVLYYSNDTILADVSGNLYYGDGNRLADGSGNLYYGNGNLLADGSGDLYWGNGLGQFTDGYGYLYYNNNFCLADPSGNLYYGYGPQFTDTTGNVYVQNSVIFSPVSVPATANTLYVDSATGALMFLDAAVVDHLVSPLPLTTKGDLLATAAAGALARLPVGTNGQVLTANSAATDGIDWETPAAQYVTAVTFGDGLTYSAGTITFVGSYCTTVGTVTTGTWQATPIATAYGGTGNLLTAKGDLLTFSTVVAKLGVGTNGQVLTANSAASGGIDWTTPSSTSIVTAVTNGDGLNLNGGGTLSFIGSSCTTVGTITTGTWQATPIATAYGGTGNLLTTKGDILTYSTTVAKLGVGTNGKVLTANSAATDGIDWETPASQYVTAVTVGDGLTYSSGTIAFVGSSCTTVGTITVGTWQGTLISPTYGGTGVNNGSNTLTLAGNLTTSGAFNSTFTMTAATSVTFPTSGTLMTNPLTTKGDLIVTSVGTPSRLAVGTNGQVLTVNSAATNGVDWETPAAAVITSVTTGDGLTLTSGVLSMTGANITTVGTISSGTWNGTVVGPSYGGTGVNNGTKTITLGGNLTTSGAFTTTLTTTANTNVTLPTSGTLLANPLTTKGDLLIYGTTPTRLPVGASGLVPVSNPSDPLGITWETNTAAAIQTLSADPGSPAVAEVWYNSTSSTPKIDTTYGVEVLSGTLLVSITQSQTITATSQVEYNQVAVIPANTLVAGSTLHLFATGSYTATVANTMDFQLRFGASVLLDTSTLAVAGTNKHWSVDAYFTVLTNGSSGTATAGGTVGLTGSTSTSTLVSTSGTAIDTTVTSNFGVSVAFGNTGSSTFMSYLLIEVKN